MNELAGPPSALTLRYHPSRGGSTDSFGPDSDEGYYGIDAREENVWGLAFDTPPLKAPLEIFGFAQAHLYVSATAPIANWMVQLYDLAPDGTSNLVTRGFLNGTHRHSHTHPEALVPNEIYAIDVQLMCAGYRYSPGHVIRVVVTNAEFPVVWPSPYPMTTTLYTGGDQPSFIALPVLPALNYRERHLPILSEAAESGKTWRSGDGMTGYQLTRDLISSETTAHYQMGPDELWCRVNDNDPARASMQLSTKVVHTPEGAARRIEAQAEGSLSSTVDTFVMDIECTLLENGRVVRKKALAGHGEAGTRLRDPHTSPPAAPPRVRIRWWIFGFMCAFAFIAYVQRQTITVASERMMPDLAFSQWQIGLLYWAFVAGYAGFQFLGGLYGQRVGARPAFVAMSIVAFAAMVAIPATSLIVGGGTLFALLMLMQLVLGVAQAPIFPVSAGVFESWFPASRWSLVLGLQAMFMNLGSATTPPLIAQLMHSFGWRAALLWSSLPALALIAWWAWYGRNTPREHRSVSAAELAELGQAPAAAGASRIDWAHIGRLVRDRNLLAITFSYLCMNYVFYLLSGWCFLYLVQERHFTVLEGGWLASLPPLGAALGAGVGGVLGSRLFTRFGPRWGFRLIPLIAMPAAGLALIAAGRGGQSLLGGGRSDDSLCGRGTHRGTGLGRDDVHRPSGHHGGNRRAQYGRQFGRTDQHSGRGLHVGTP